MHMWCSFGSIGVIKIRTLKQTYITHILYDKYCLLDWMLHVRKCVHAISICVSLSAYYLFHSIWIWIHLKLLTRWETSGHYNFTLKID